jgi:thiol:disulfide interchange protein DsbC
MGHVAYLCPSRVNQSINLARYHLQFRELANEVANMGVVHIRLLALALSATAAGAHADAGQLGRILAERMPGMEIHDIQPAPVSGLYEVVAEGARVFYTDAKGEFALFGNLVDLKSQRSLTANRVEQLRQTDFSRLPLDKAIVKVKGTGMRKLAVFSDPDCPYCRQLERELQSVTDVTIYTFLFPLAELHPEAVGKAERVWCSGNPAQAWDKLMIQGEDPAGAGNCATPIGEIADLAKKLHINGTPGLVFPDGRIVPGVLPKKQLEDRLNAASKS